MLPRKPNLEERSPGKARAAQNRRRHSNEKHESRTANSVADSTLNFTKHEQKREQFRCGTTGELTHATLACVAPRRGRQWQRRADIN